jgi:hypothetical protein
MELKDLLIEVLDRLGPIRFSNSFGWICIYTGRNMFGGYKIIDNNILMLFLILSPQSFNIALANGFLKFDFGKTWAQVEITGENDLENITEFLEDAFNYTNIRKLKNKNTT